MSFLACLSVWFLIFEGCKKKENIQLAPPPTPVLNDSALKITAAEYKDLNEFEIRYQINPTVGLTYTNIFLVWSTSSSFADADSILVVSSTATSTSGSYKLKGLKDSITYYARLRMIYANKPVSSNV